MKKKKEICLDLALFLDVHQVVTLEEHIGDLHRPLPPPPPPPPPLLLLPLRHQLRLFLGLGQRMRAILGGGGGIKLLL